MLAFFDSFGDAISAFLQFVRNLVSGVITLISGAFSASETLTILVVYLPDILVGFVGIALTISIFYLFVGR